jgi:hypothetical protein
VGIILSVIPRITPEGMIVMELIANKSELSGETVVIFTDAADGTTVTSPIINQTRAQTTIKVLDGQTVVVGGMITNSDVSFTRRVPWLGDLPILGHAFRFEANRHERKELLIFLTPRIQRTPYDVEYVKQVEIERTHMDQCQAEEIHGPLFGLPAEGQPGAAGYGAPDDAGAPYYGGGYPAVEPPAGASEHPPLPPAEEQAPNPPVLPLQSNGLRSARSPRSAVRTVAQER